METYSSIILISLSAVLLSCSTENTPAYLLSTSVEPAGSGIVTPGQGEFEKGDTVRISATANNDWVFAGWTGDHTGTGNSVVITMDRDKDISALFEIKKFALEIQVDGEGTVSEMIVQQKSADYEVNTVVELTANPAEGWVFTGWDGDLQGDTNPAQLEITEDMVVTAMFARDYFDVTISLGDGNGGHGAGSISIDLVSGNRDGDRFEYESEIRVTIGGTAGNVAVWQFSHWEGDFNGSENPIQVSVTSDITATAITKIVD